MQTNSVRSIDINLASASPQLFNQFSYNPNLFQEVPNDFSIHSRFKETSMHSTSKKMPIENVPHLEIKNLLSIYENAHANKGTTEDDMQLMLSF